MEEKAVVNGCYIKTVYSGEEWYQVKKVDIDIRGYDKQVIYTTDNEIVRFSDITGIKKYYKDSNGLID